MKKWFVLALVVVLHAWLSVYSFSVMLGMGHLQPESRSKLRQYTWGCIHMVTWQPVLYPICYHVRLDGRRLVDRYFYPCVVLNSLTAVGLGYASYLGIRKYRSKQHD